MSSSYGDVYPYPYTTTASADTVFDNNANIVCDGDWGHIKVGSTSLRPANVWKGDNVPKRHMD